MVLDVLRGYVQVAGGLSDVTVQRAREVATALVTHSADATDRGREQVQALADDLMKQSQTNREVLVGLIRTEVDRAVGRMGFVREEELAAVRSHVQRLETQLRQEKQKAPSTAAPAKRAPAKRAPAKKAAAKKAAAPASDAGE